MIPMAFYFYGLFEYESDMCEKNTFRLELANQIIEIHSLYKKCQEMCGDYVLMQKQYTKPDIEIDIVLRNILRENDMSQDKDYLEGEGQYLYNDPGYLEYFVLHRKISEVMPLHSVILMHGSVVSYEGWGFMFSAPSGTGKTTRAKMWLDVFEGSFIVNGDKPLIKVNDNAAYAYGTPWSGKENLNRNVGVPMRAIFLLERTDENEKSSLQKVSKSEAFLSLLQQTYKPQNGQALTNTLSLIKQLVEVVNIYRFRSALSTEAIMMAWKTAVREKKLL